MSAQRLRKDDTLSRISEHSRIVMTVDRVVRSKFHPRRAMVYGVVEWYDLRDNTRESRARTIWVLRKLGGRWWLTADERIRWSLTHEKPAQMRLPLPRMRATA